MEKFSSIIKTHKRLIGMFMLVAFIFICLIFRLFYVSIIKMGEYQTIALSQWTRDVPNEAVRGDILDRNGVVLATTVTSYDLYVRGNMVENKQQTALSLSLYLDVSYEEIFASISKSVSEVLICTGLSKEQMESLQESGIDGLYFSLAWERVYPYGALLSQTLGYVGSDGSGQAGLELLYDEYLSGTDGKIYTQTDLVGREVEGEQYITAAINGNDITLTIDVEIQQILENSLKSAALTSNPESISGIIMDPDTFEVLAIANYPTFDLNDIPRDDLEYLNEISRNIALTDVYEPGSTFKIITAAANVEEYFQGNENAFSTDYIFPSASTRTVLGGIIKCWSDHKNGKHQDLDLLGALENSCNPIFVDIALSLGTETFYDYLEAFGLTEKTGIDFIGEAGSILIAEENVTDGDLARMGFGQTVAVSKIQLLSAVSAAINGGTLKTPTLLSSVSHDGMVIYKNISEIKSTPISEETSEYIRNALQSVVENGSGKLAMVAGEVIGGKTGTAQKYENGVIASGKYVSSFVGYMGDPARYAILITVDEPEGVYYGSQVCGPIAGGIFTQIAYLEDYRELLNN